jgi:hypothetical protein
MARVGWVYMRGLAAFLSGLLVLRPFIMLMPLALLLVGRTDTTIDVHRFTCVHLSSLVSLSMLVLGSGQRFLRPGTCCTPLLSLVYR